MSASSGSSVNSHTRPTRSPLPVHHSRCSGWPQDRLREIGSCANKGSTTIMQVSKDKRNTHYAELQMETGRLGCQERRGTLDDGFLLRHIEVAILDARLQEVSLLQSATLVTPRQTSLLG
ncbi:hypothetical protein GOP47_0015047 [Adiantum capillus-veneris]|uniref:Uncharacterized protein n=1 Tax=Adiantum capillus-veneris TaxID=13818 RepID=A0A9D4ZD07_ADICA|nr:hypothetical protein GOP47_0015047 [Adiantum capillus-veneris]